MPNSLCPLSRCCRVLLTVTAFSLGSGQASRSSVFADENPPKSAGSTEKPERTWQWKTGDEIYQLVTVAKRPRFQVQGLPLESKIRYKLLSRLTMRISPFDNSLTIKQAVVTTKLEEADEVSKAIVSKQLKDLTGKTITIRVGADGKVMRIQGVPEPEAAAVTNGLDVRGAMMSSLIDRDGWKELTKATIFTLPEPLKPESTWSEPVEHAWGPLGGWKGTSAFQSQGKDESLQKIGYVLKLRYRPPGQEENNLPFKIANPMFRIKKAEGVLKYDPAKGRLSSMEETFHVAGRMTIQIAGQNVPLQLEEQQQFQLQLFDEKPPPEKR